LQELGFMVDVRPDPNEFCNRTITVYGKGGVVPPGGTEQQPMELFVGNAGTAARFLSAFVCLGKGVYRVHGIPRMNERPKKALFQALRQLGYRVESANDKLPAVIHGEGPKPGAKCTVNIEESSQFASALLLCARIGGWQIEVVGENAEESPYVAMTSKLIEAFPNRGGKFQIEPDASSGSYFWAAGAGRLWVEEKTFWMKVGTSNLPMSSMPFDSVSVAGWPKSGFQIDQAFPFHFGLVLEGVPVEEVEEVARAAFHFEGSFSRKEDLGDSIMTAIALAPFASKPCSFTDLGRLRLQETERVIALRTELTKCGAKVVEEGDTLTVYPSKLHSAEIETYNDHRMAMCFAILGLKVPGIKIKNPACVKKTFPNFFQKLAAKPPQGLGATILDAKTGRALTHDELFAE
jgi:3-phosphoshikimate 1-carboxyvinyltransferase